MKKGGREWVRGERGKESERMSEREGGRERECVCVYVVFTTTATTVHRRVRFKT